MFFLRFDTYPDVLSMTKLLPYHRCSKATLPGPTNLPRIPALQGNLGRKLPSFSHLQSSMDWFKGPIAGTCFFDSWELSLSKLPHLGINLPFRTDPCLLVVSSPIHPILGFVWICLQCLQSQQLSMFGWMPHGVKNWSSANQGYQWMVCKYNSYPPPN